MPGTKVHFSHIIPYLKGYDNCQQYLVQRIQGRSFESTMDHVIGVIADLSRDGCLGGFRWNGGAEAVSDRPGIIKWNPDFPTDAQVG